MVPLPLVPRRLLCRVSGTGFNQQPGKLLKIVGHCFERQFQLVFYQAQIPHPHIVLPFFEVGEDAFHGAAAAATRSAEGSGVGCRAKLATSSDGSEAAHETIELVATLCRRTHVDEVVHTAVLFQDIDDIGALDAVQARLHLGAERRAPVQVEFVLLDQVPFGEVQEQVVSERFERDVVAVEKTEQYKGRYHVLQGALSPIDGVGPEQLRVRELLTRVREEHIDELILCTNPNIEGETTALYLAKLLKDTDLRITRIASGLPVGGDLEYADEMTLGRALTGRVVLD